MSGVKVAVKKEKVAIKTVVPFIVFSLSILSKSSHTIDVEVISMLSIDETIAEKTMRKIKMFMFERENPFFTAKISRTEKSIFKNPPINVPFFAVFSSFAERIFE